MNGGEYTCKAEDGGFLYASGASRVNVASALVANNTAMRRGGAVSGFRIRGLHYRQRHCGFLFLSPYAGRSKAFCLSLQNVLVFESLGSYVSFFDTVLLLFFFVLVSGQAVFEQVTTTTTKRIGSVQARTGIACEIRYSKGVDRLSHVSPTLYESASTRNSYLLFSLTHLSRERFCWNKHREKNASA